MSSVPGTASRFDLDSPALAARLIYDVLHRCDSLGRESIIVVMPPDSPEWQAVRDRLRRATLPLKRVGPAVSAVRTTISLEESSLRFKQWQLRLGRRLGKLQVKIGRPR